MNTKIALFTDSIYPLIDGVANVVENYASRLNAVVVAPNHPDAQDSRFPYPVYRYHSLDLRKKTGYMVGWPFSRSLAKKLENDNIGLIHTHSPASAMILARECRQFLKVPVVMTYHSKYDVDIKKAVQMKLIQEEAISAMVENISACDELWTVSKGAGESLKDIGFKGNYIVMENGVDMPCERASQEQIEKYTAKYNLPADRPVFIFVGRMVLYKGQKLIIDALKEIADTGRKFTMVFVGDGQDLNEIKSYAKSSGINDYCIFTGSIKDRQALRAWYSRADMMIFPSTYDTNGLVVREAASCSLPSMVLANSCVSEGITNNRNGFLISGTVANLALRLADIIDHPQIMKEVGVNAANQIYISWDDAVKKASTRYAEVIENYKKGLYKRHRTIPEEFYKLNGELMDFFADL